MIRESWVEEAKGFKMTSCKSINPVAECSPFFLGSEALAYESALTGNEKHLRIFRTAFRTAINEADRQLAAKEGKGETENYIMFWHFAPYSLTALED